MVAATGAVGVDLGSIRDDRDVIECALRDAVRDCDAVISSGGVSMGDFDFVKAVLDEIGDMRWMQVAIKPAKPLAAGTVDAGDGRRVAVLGLPGNPVSSIVSFELFARPAIRALMGHGLVDPARLDRPRLAARAEGALPRRADGKIHFARVVLAPDGEAGLVARSAGSQGSHHTAAMAAANALAVLPDGAGVADGDPVSVFFLD
jgi:molybdenum cofactor synthesis domain-containing protein